MVVNPYPPGGGSWFTPTGSPNGVPSWDATHAISPQASVSQILTSMPRPPGANPTSPANNGQQSGQADVQRWDQYMAQIQQQIQPIMEALRAGAGQDMKFKYEQLKRQYEDAAEARKNAMEIARLQAETSRYGVDVGRQTEIDRLRQNQQQFEANHALAQAEFGLKQQEFGLNVGKAFTEYGRTYDDLFALQDLKANVASIGAGRGPVSMRETGTPHAKTWEDWSALTGLAMPGQQPTQMRTNEGPGSGQPGSPGMVSPTGDRPATDPRLTAANAVMRALPPSTTLGNDGQDWAAINAITSLYMGRKPGQVEALGQERQRAAQGALRRAGYSPALVEEERQRSLPGQRGVRVA